ncbi:MAG: hypothetical protein ACPGTP_00540 [Bacteroidia bacterium]
MKKAFHLALVLVFLASCSDSQPESEQEQVHKQVDYSVWHAGKFYYREKATGTYLINRTDSIQEEFIKMNAMVVEFVIKWQNDSTYTLDYTRISENPNNKEVAEGIDSLIKTCTITEVEEKSYVEKATSNMTDEVIYTRIYRY